MAPAATDPAPQPQTMQRTRQPKGVAARALPRRGGPGAMRAGILDPTFGAPP